MCFWEEKTLQEMTLEEWESLCDGCGQCCLNKLIDEDTDEIYYTNVACDLLDISSCQCRHYDNRFEYVPDCIKLTLKNISKIKWLPKTCAYRLIYEQKKLPDWHPLITHSKQAMKRTGIVVSGYACYESDVTDWEDHIMNKPQKA